MENSLYSCQIEISIVRIKTSVLYYISFLYIALHFCPTLHLSVTSFFLHPPFSFLLHSCFHQLTPLFSPLFPIYFSDNDDPMVRGLALRSLCNLRLITIFEYVQAPLQKCLGDPSAYVRKTAVMGVLKVITIFVDYCITYHLPIIM